MFKYLLSNLSQVPANHLISASIMAAPCALAISKLSYPETEQSKTTGEDVAKMEARFVFRRLALFVFEDLKANDNNRPTDCRNGPYTRDNKRQNIAHYNAVRDI